MLSSFKKITLGVATAALITVSFAATSTPAEARWWRPGWHHGGFHHGWGWRGGWRGGWGWRGGYWGGPRVVYGGGPYRCWVRYTYWGPRRVCGW